MYVQTGNLWLKVFQDIEGQYYSWYVATSMNGNIVSVGAYTWYFDTPGVVRMYRVI